jgi:hypothetical protein
MIIRFEITDPAGKVTLPDGVASALPTSTPLDDAKGLLVGMVPAAGWKVRLWKGVDLVSSLDSLGEPDAVAVSS